MASPYAPQINDRLSSLLPTTRKTRFVLISDTHNSSPPSAFRLPPGDVLVHAGDLTKNGSRAELNTAFTWIEKSDFQVKIVVAGNHDLGLDPPSTSPYGEGNDGEKGRTEADVASVEDCTDLISQFPGITFLNHESMTVRLRAPPYTSFEAFGSGYSMLPASSSGRNEGTDTHSGRYTAFQYPSSRIALNPWSTVPSSTDVLITHTPPLSYCDAGKGGCPSLQHLMEKVRPRLAVCGHIHAGRGAEMIKFMEDRSAHDHEANCRKGISNKVVTRWKDNTQGTKKLSKIDLTEGGRKLDPRDWEVVRNDSTEHDKTQRVESEAAPATYHEQQNIGAGTCVVNAAIMSTSWPYRKGQDRFNKPIVVDLDLPVWKQE